MGHIRKVKSFPINNLAVTQEMLEPFLRSGKSVESEVKDDRFYILDFKVILLKYPS
jgi:hypothetical protein